MSSRKCYYFLRVLTFHSKLNESIDDRIEFFKCILPQVGNTWSPPPSLGLYSESLLSPSPIMFSPFFATSSSYLVLYHPSSALYLLYQVSPSPLLYWSTYVCVSLGHSHRLFEDVTIVTKWLHWPGSPDRRSLKNEWQEGKGKSIQRDGPGAGSSAQAFNPSLSPVRGE